MQKFIKVSESRYGNRTCIYHYINPNQIIEFHIEETLTEINIEATLSNGMKAIIYNQNDLKNLINEEELKILKKQYDCLMNKS